MSDAGFPQHVYTIDIPKTPPIHCKRCGEEIPRGKLGCEACMWEINNAHYMEHQKSYAALIAASKVELTLVYIAGGKGGERAPLWHLQRFGDIRRGYCGAELPAGNQQDHLKFNQLYQRDKFCVECAKALVKVLDDVPADRTENPSIRG